MSERDEYMDFDPTMLKQFQAQARGFMQLNPEPPDYSAEGLMHITVGSDPRKDADFAFLLLTGTKSTSNFHITNATVPGNPLEPVVSDPFITPLKEDNWTLTYEPADRGTGGGGDG